MPVNLEASCKAAEAAAANLEDSAKRLLQAARIMRKAAGEGNASKVRQTAAQIEQSIIDVGKSASVVADAWNMSDTDLISYLQNDFSAELVEAAAALGIKLNQLDDRLAAFPVIICVLANQRAIKLNSKRHASLRPSVVAEKIKLQISKAKSKPEQFIEILYRAYRLVVGENAASGAPLVDLYEALTLLPESRRSYEKAEFIRDVHLLDASHVRTTKSGASVSFPAATGTRGNKSFQVIPPDGMPRFYFGVRFEGSDR